MKNNVLTMVKPFVTKHQPEILMAMGLSGMIFSVVWGIKSTIIATRIIDAEKLKRDVDKLPLGDIFKLTWKLYLPVVLSTIISVPCIVAGNSVSTKRNAALAAAYTLSETALQEYQEKTKEIVGEKKEKDIREAVSSDLISSNYKNSSQVLITGDGEALFYEPLSGRYFKSNWNKILKAANEINASAMGDISGRISLTEWFDSIGLDGTGLSDDIGWDTTDGKFGIIDIRINSSLTPDNIPCGAIDYVNRPKPFRD